MEKAIKIFFVSIILLIILGFFIISSYKMEQANRKNFYTVSLLFYIPGSQQVIPFNFEYNNYSYNHGSIIFTIYENGIKKRRSFKLDYITIIETSDIISIEPVMRDYKPESLYE